MKVYFYGPPTNITKYQEAYQEIIAKLAQAGFQVFSRIESTYVTPLKEETIQKIQASGESYLGYVDGVVLETTLSDQEIGYLLAFAILQKKPILCLYQSGSHIKETLSRLGKDIPPFIMVKSYRLKDIEQIILNFTTLFGIDPEQSDIPKIKFTLRISPKISNFLRFKIHGTKKSKADFLREQIRKIIEQDEEYKNYLAKRKK